MTFRKILCPVDFSECSRHALDHAVAIARRSGGAVTALHAVLPVPYADPLMASAIVFTQDDLDRIRLELKNFVSDEVGRTPVATVLVQANSVPGILEHARELPADLIVMGTHGRGGFERLMLGSVTERILRKATCPVLTVPPRVADAVPAGPVVFKKILCAIDFSPASEKALAYATSLARESEAGLTLVHVVEPLPVYEPVVAGGTGFFNYEELATEATRARLHDIAPRDGRVREVVTTGKPYREILRHAHEEGSDLIVIGVHGRVVDRIGFFGSTTNHIVREAACPVLSLRA